jgi:hypothetical protein
MEVRRMKHEPRFHRISMRVHLHLWPFSAHDRRLPFVLTRLSLRFDELLAGHLQIAQRKQRDEPRGVLGKAPVADLSVAELMLDNLERVFDFGTTNQLFKCLALSSKLPQRECLSRALRLLRRVAMPFHASRRWALGGALMPSVSKSPRSPSQAAAGAIRSRH